MPPAESRVKMNGFAAPDTAAGICSAAIKRGFAAPSPDFPAHNFIFSESNLRKILDSTEQCTRGDKRLKELLKLVARNREELDGTLTDKQKETLEKFEDCMNEMHSITERDAFSYGFRLGVQLMVESLSLIHI